MVPSGFHLCPQVAFAARLSLPHPSLDRIGLPEIQRVDPYILFLIINWNTANQTQFEGYHDRENTAYPNLKWETPLSERVPEDPSSIISLSTLYIRALGFVGACKQSTTAKGHFQTGLTTTRKLWSLSTPGLGVLNPSLSWDKLAKVCKTKKGANDGQHIICDVHLNHAIQGSLRQLFDKFFGLLALPVDFLQLKDCHLRFSPKIGPVWKNTCSDDWFKTWAP